MAFSLTNRDFLDLVEAGYLRAAPDKKGTTKRIWSLLQVHFGNPRIHFEVWPQRKTGRIEIGLHFEGERSESYAWAEQVGAGFHTIAAELGPGVELEEWTASWARIHETIPMPDLTPELAADVAERLGAYVSVLVPLLEIAGVPFKSAARAVQKRTAGRHKRPARRKQPATL
jgi:hypothetical protein